MLILGSSIVGIIALKANAYPAGTQPSKLDILQEFQMVPIMSDSERLLLLQKELCEYELDLLDYFESHDPGEAVESTRVAVDVRPPYGMCIDQDTP